MNDIDFLPANYVCVQVTRTNNNWLRGLFVAVLALMAMGWMTQQRSMSDMTRRRDRIQEQATAALAQIDTGEELRQGLSGAENDLRLLQGLKSQIPPSRWLLAIVGALPEQASITEIHAEIDDGTDPSGRPEGAGAKPNPNAPVADPVQQDLDRLIKLASRRSLSISLRGSAADDLEVSRFLAALRKTDMFERVQLLFTDQQGQGDRPLRSFAIRLRTKPVGRRREPAPNSGPVAEQSLGARR